MWKVFYVFPSTLLDRDKQWPLCSIEYYALCLSSPVLPEGSCWYPAVFVCRLRPLDLADTHSCWLARVHTHTHTHIHTRRYTYTYTYTYS